jgi:hypothetical protein
VRIRSDYTPHVVGTVVEVAEPGVFLAGAWPVVVRHDDGTHAVYGFDEVEVIPTP